MYIQFVCAHGFGIIGFLQSRTEITLTLLTLYFVYWRMI